MEKFKVVNENVAMSGNVFKLIKEKCCSNGTLLGSFTIIFYEPFKNSQTGVMGMSTCFQNVITFDEALINQAKGFVRGEFIMVKGHMLQRYEVTEEIMENGSVKITEKCKGQPFIKALSLESLCLPKRPWKEKLHIM